MSDRVPLSQVLDKPLPAPKPAVIDPVAEEAKKPSPDIAGQSPPEGELTYFTDMRALSIQLGFEDNSFDGMSREAEQIYGWAKKVTGINGGPEVLMRIKYLVEDLGTNNTGKTLLRSVAQWTSLDTRTRDLSLRKQLV